MSLILVTGIPGCGKSYFATHELMYGGLLDKYYVLHNIEGLKPEFFNNEYLKDWTTIAPENRKEFFSRAYFDGLVQEAKDKFNRPLLLMVDEAWEWFDKEDESIKSFISWHRHIGMDIWLITQDVSDLARCYRKRVEYDVQGNKSGVVDKFLYNYVARGRGFRTRPIMKKQEVFAAYTSFTHDGAKKPRSKLIPMTIGCLVASVLIMIYTLAYGVPNMFGAKKVPPVPSQVASVPVPVAKKEAPKEVRVQKRIGISGVDWSMYSFASCYGDSAFVQDSEGHLIPIQELAPGAYVVQCRGNGAIISPVGGASIEKVLSRRGVVKVKVERGLFDGGGGQGVSLTPVEQSGGKGALSAK